MKTKSRQNRFMKIITLPLRALAKARDKYIRAMNNLADTGNYEGVGWGAPVYSDPMSRSMSTTAMRKSETDDRDLKELVRAASTGALGNRLLVTSLISGTSGAGKTTSVTASTPETQKANLGFPKGVPRSGSIVMAKIEEDEPSKFEDGEVDGGVKDTKPKNGLFARSGSKSVGKTRRTSAAF